MEKDKLIKMLIGFLPLLLLFLDPPEGMDPKAWGLFPFYAGAILMVMLRPVGEATALAIFLGLYAVIMRGHTVALSGFALTMRGSLSAPISSPRPSETPTSASAFPSG